LIGIYSHHHHHYHHISVMELGHLLTRCGLICPEAYAMIPKGQWPAKLKPILPNSHPCFSRYTLFSEMGKWQPSHSGITVSPGMEEMPSLNTPVQRLKVATLPLDSPCSGPVTHSGEILTAGKSHRMNPAFILCYRNVWVGMELTCILVRKLQMLKEIKW
jgi:hypothetical protein